MRPPQKTPELRDADQAVPEGMCEHLDPAMPEAYKPPGLLPVPEQIHSHSAPANLNGVSATRTQSDFTDSSVFLSHTLDCMHQRLCE